MLATANRSIISIHVTKFFLAMAGDVVDPAKIFLSSSLVTMQNLVVACRTSWAYVGRSKKICMNVGLRVVSDPLQTFPSPTCITMTNLVILGQTARASVEKFGPRIPSFKVTQGHRNGHGSIGYL